MPPSVVSRTHKRNEKRQKGLFAALVAFIALTSFALGFMLGNPSDLNQTLSVGDATAERPVQVEAAASGPEVKSPAEATEKLTFYDNLPKGDQAPLGSGINLPPSKVIPNEPAPSQTENLQLKVPAPQTEEDLRSKLVPPHSGSGFVVQVASFRSEDEARKLIEQLKKLDLATSIERADLGEKGIWHRVLSGPYSDRNDAEKVAERLKKERQLSALVKHR